MSTIFTRMMKKSEVDQHNRILMNSGEEKDYICILCREYVGKSESYSNRGKNLMCISCFDSLSELLNIKPLQLMDILHTQYRIPLKAELEAFNTRLLNISNILDLSNIDSKDISYNTIYDKYWKTYCAINSMQRDFRKQFDLVNYEQNMNKKSIDTGYQE